MCPAEAIDQAAKEFGMPMGPIELADKVGLDICLSVAEHLAPHFGFSIPDKLAQLVAKKHLGAKTGSGFYRYDRQGHPIIRKTVSFPAPDLTDRLILRMCNEAVACWGEKIVSELDFIDAGMIDGVGFAPFLGGPMEYIRKSNPAVLKEKLILLTDRYGERFRPSSEWDKLFQ